MRTVALGLLLAVAGCGPAVADDVVAVERAETRTSERLTLTSNAFGPGEAIPLRYSAYGAGLSPPLAWGDAPAGTRSFALMVEDPDATSVRPYIHWMAWNIPAEARSLPEGLSASATGMVQGRNSRDRTGWFGPRPHGRSAHRYYFQLFALDVQLSLPHDASRKDLLEALDGHVLAAGVLIGTFREPREGS